MMKQLRWILLLVFLLAGFTPAGQTGLPTYAELYVNDYANVIDDVLQPHFEREQYAEGLTKAVPIITLYLITPAINSSSSPAVEPILIQPAEDEPFLPFLSQLVIGSICVALLAFGLWIIRNVGSYNSPDTSSGWESSSFWDSSSSDDGYSSDGGDSSDGGGASGDG